MSRKLTDKQQVFVKEYLKDLNATQAAIRAGCELGDTPPKSGWYVYFLVDPRTDSVFYVGKGSGSRMNDHMRNYHGHRIANPAQAKVIAEVCAAGLEPRAVVFRSFLNEGEAYDSERALIGSFPSLTNSSPGFRSAKESMRQHYEYMLSRMASLDCWLGRLPDAKREIINRIWGSPEECYRVIRDELVKDAENPPPNVATVGPDGKVTLGWER